MFTLVGQPNPPWGSGTPGYRVATGIRAGVPGTQKGPLMADPNWVVVERFHGQMRRVTLLDEEFQVIVTHDRGLAPADVPSDEVQIMRAVELAEMAHTA